MHSQNANAQMAESVDALVSNTSGATRAGSTPALGTEAGKVERLSSLIFFALVTPWFADRLSQGSVEKYWWEQKQKT